MAWLEIHQTLPAHRKTLAAADALDMHPAHFMGHIITFWLWALDNVPDGNLDEVSARMIARAAQWEGDPDTLLNTLIEVGFIDQDDDGLAIHDWYDYAGKLMEQRQKSVKDQRRSADKGANVKEKTAGRPPDDRRTTAEKPLAQYSTVQYLTVPLIKTYAPDGAQVDEHKKPNQGHHSRVWCRRAF